jgi:hypothetical protein
MYATRYNLASHAPEPATLATALKWNPGMRNHGFAVHNCTRIEHRLQAGSASLRASPVTPGNHRFGATPADWAPLESGSYELEARRAVCASIQAQGLAELTGKHL